MGAHRRVAWIYLVAALAWCTFFVWGAQTELQQANDLDSQNSIDNSAQGWAQTLGFKYTGPAVRQDPHAVELRHEVVVLFVVAFLGLIVFGVVGLVKLRTARRVEQAEFEAVLAGRYENADDTEPEADDEDEDEGAHGQSRVAERIRELGQLRDSGLVTSDEFDQKKSELLREL